VVLGDGTKIEPRHLPSSLAPAAQPEGPPAVPGASIHDLERYAILKTLEAMGGSTSRAATVLGISARKIQYKLHEYQTGRRRPDEDE
jgi:DNA-binding NtrC family response regulator